MLGRHEMRKHLKLPVIGTDFEFVNWEDVSSALFEWTTAECTSPL